MMTPTERAMALNSEDESLLLDLLDLAEQWREAYAHHERVVVIEADSPLYPVVKEMCESQAEGE